jgi:hypothetical protein
VPQRYRGAWLLALNLAFASTLIPAQSKAALAQALIDRKFPVGQFCPIETRYGSLLTFQAPDNGAVRITFIADNQYPDFGGDCSDPENEFDPIRLLYNDPGIDDVFVLTLDQWLANQQTCDYPCFFNDFPNGADDVGPGVPSYPNDPASLAALAYAEIFFDAPGPSSPWEGGSWRYGITGTDGDPSGSFCESKTDGGSFPWAIPISATRRFRQT